MELRIGKPAEAGMSAARLAHIAKLANRWVEEESVHPSLALLVARRGVVVLHEAFGQLTPAPNSPPLSVDSLFPLMSTHKPMLATLAMILVEEGELGLYRPVTYYLPEFSGPGKEKILVYQLLTHTAGMLDEEMHAQAEERKGSVRIPPKPVNQHPAIHEYLSLRYDLPLSYEPGSQQRYCSFGYELVGEIIRRISGQSYASFAQERLFTPLGMVDTHYVVPDDARSRIVIRPADCLGADWLNSRSLQDTPWAGTGGAFSTVMDMAVFGQMFLNGGVYGDARILSPVTVAEMTRNQIPGTSAQFMDQFFPEAGWGLGWTLHLNKQVAAFSDALQSAETFIHGGWGGTILLVDPIHELVMCYFSVEQSRQDKWVDLIRVTRADLFFNGVSAAIVEI